VFESIIKFTAPKDYIENNKEYLPVPIKLNIPDWFKKLEHGVNNKTIKGCIPFLDTLTSGYLLKMPVDYYLVHNIENEGILKTGMQSGTMERNGLNVNFGQPQFHNTKQLGESPYVEKNKNLAFHKILNPWTIKTPPGYSCLFVPPLNNTDDRFSIIPGIVDTDFFPTEINFPFVVNGDKYPTLETTIKIGTPYVQVIPFKKESWKMKIGSENSKDRETNNFFAFKHILHNYKKLFWSKKSWK
jgi:hypothetical protein|tara:strand:+ start:327 stop:1055 length:729 start_codon:yes stop_codon:yes gene_type:complete